MVESTQVQNQCILTNDSIFLNSKQDTKFIVIYFLLHVLSLLATPVFMFAPILNALLLILVRNPFVVSFWYQIGYGEKYHSHTSIPLGLFRIFIVNGRLFTVIPSLSTQVNVRLDAYRLLSHEEN